MQYIGKLMRARSTPSRSARRSRRCSSAARADALALHQAEPWRDELIADDDALDALDRRSTRETDAAAAAQPDPQARKDARADARRSARSGRAYRELFQFIKRQQAR